MHDRPTSRRQFLACTGAAAAALVVSTTSEPVAVGSFDDGFEVPEYHTRVPWLISESGLYELIPQSAFDYSIAGWPVLEFTLLGIKAAYGFNFVTHSDDLLLEIAYQNYDESSVDSTYKSAESQLTSQLVEPERGYGEGLFWNTSSVCLSNQISSGYFPLLKREIRFHRLALVYSRGWPS